jgi:uncharacterized protein (DUF4415 family)
MQNGEDIKKYTVEEIRAMRRRGESRTNWQKIDTMTDEEIERLISEDPGEAGIEWAWDQARLALPEAKTHVSLRVDADVLRFFKSQGRGYQTRINAVLRAYMRTQLEKRP